MTDPRSRSRSRGSESAKMADFSANMHVNVIKRLMVNYDTPRQYAIFPDRFLIFILFQRYLTFEVRVSSYEESTGSPV